MIKGLLSRVGAQQTADEKEFLLSEKSALALCQLATCAKGGDPLLFVKEGKCPGLPGKTKPISIFTPSGVEYKHEPSCEHCRALRKDYA